VSQNLEEAAGQFEALLLAQMLRHMRETSAEGWMGTGDDQAGQQMMGVAEEQLAQALASSGGLGLARIIEEQFGRHETNAMR
jgi:flagellar protein FlgJ